MRLKRHPVPSILQDAREMETKAEHVEGQFYIKSHLMGRANSLEKTLMLGKTEGRIEGRGRDGWMASPTQWT